MNSRKKKEEDYILIRVAVGILTTIAVKNRLWVSEEEDMKLTIMGRADDSRMDCNYMTIKMVVNSTGSLYYDFIWARIVLLFL